MNKCELHKAELAEDGLCDICEGRGLWEGDPVPPEDAAGAMQQEYEDD